MARKGENIRKRKDGRWEARYQKGRKADGSILYGYIYGKKYTDVKKGAMKLSVPCRQSRIPCPRRSRKILC